MRGAIVNAKLRMSSENPYSQQNAPAAAAPSLSLVTSGAGESTAPADGAQQGAGAEPPRFLIAPNRAA